MDGITKYKSAEEEAADFKAHREEREKLLDEHIAGMPAAWFKPEYLAEHGTKTVTVDYLSRYLAKLNKHLTRKIFNQIYGFQDQLLEHYLVVQRDRIRALKAEVAELKATGPNMADAYKGPWMIGSFKRGNIVTHGGSLFLALADTVEKPGTGDCWKLVCKRGADGKDLRG